MYFVCTLSARSYALSTFFHLKPYLDSKYLNDNITNTCPGNKNVSKYMQTVAYRSKIDITLCSSSDTLQ